MLIINETVRKKYLIKNNIRSKISFSSSSNFVLNINVDVMNDNSQKQKTSTLDLKLFFNSSMVIRKMII
jgi:hypothetical protein